MPLNPNATYTITTDDGEKKSAKYVGQVYAGYEGNLEPRDLYVFVADERHVMVRRAAVDSQD